MSFGVSSSRISFLSHPCDYLTTLQSLVSSSRRRVFMSALYLGTDSLSRSLVSTCADVLDQPIRPCMDLLFDKGRGTRGPSESSVNICAPLMQRGAKLHLWQSPAVRSFHSLVLPARLTELLGVFHGKVHVFDDTVVLSGANLAQSYFENRKDRYVIIRDAGALADFYYDLLSIVADSSFVVKDNLFIPPKKSQLEMKERIENILNSSVALSSESEVMITPTCQLGLVGLRHDEKVMSRLFKDMKAGSKLWLTSGYFNLTAQNARLLFETSARLSSTEVLISSPAANAWSNSQGASRNVPKGYAELAAQFLRECPSGLSIRLLEWSGPPGWSYHCKGLWHMDEVCSTTIVGSANFGERSAERDFEIQAVFRSDSPQFRQLLQAELENIRKDCKVVGLADMIGDPERKLAWQWSLLLPWMKKLM